jgi:hypothetical protein
MSRTVPSSPIRGKHKLDQYIKDTYAGFSWRTHVPYTEPLEQTHKRSNVDITYKKHMGKKDDYYRYYYYKTYTKMKPDKFIAYPHPIIMGHKNKKEK